MSEPGYVGILSRHRPDTLLRCVTSCIALAGGEILIGIGFDDDFNGFNGFPQIPGVSRTLLRPRHYYARGTNAVYGFLKSIAQGAGHFCDYVVILNDDVEFQMYGWYPAAVAYLHDRFPDGMGLVELGTHGKCANFITRVAFVDEALDGELANPCYTMYCSDSELMARLRAMDRYASASPIGGGEVLRHAEKQDAMREEVKLWYPLDKAQFNRRAKEHGWTALT